MNKRQIFGSIFIGYLFFILWQIILRLPVAVNYLFGLIGWEVSGSSWREIVIVLIGGIICFGVGVSIGVRILYDQRRAQIFFSSRWFCFAAIIGLALNMFAFYSWSGVLGLMSGLDYVCGGPRISSFVAFVVTVIFVLLTFMMIPGIIASKVGKSLTPLNTLLKLIMVLMIVSAIGSFTGLIINSTLDVRNGFSDDIFPCPKK